MFLTTKRAYFSTCCGFPFASISCNVKILLTNHLVECVEEIIFLDDFLLIVVFVTRLKDFMPLLIS